MNFKNILVNQENGIVTVTINRPTKLNALNKLTIEELHEALVQIEMQETIKVVILTGSGEKAFVAGADISEFAHFSVNDGGRLAAKGQEMVFDFIENFSKPVIAAVNGFALGGGLELAMACHFQNSIRQRKDGIARSIPRCNSWVWRNTTSTSIGWERESHGANHDCGNDFCR